MNKFDLLNKVTTSTLGADNKALLIELIIRADKETWECWPSVERLCQVRGIKLEKNFKGVAHYLPGLVEVAKVGRKNHYTINVDAVEALPQFDVTIKHTPSLEELNTPSVADNTPAIADSTPSREGANSTSNTTKNTKEESTQAPLASAPVAKPSLIFKDKEEAQGPTPIDLNGPDVVAPIDSTTSDTPATEGVSADDDYYEWNGMQVLRVGRPGRVAATAPVAVKEKTPCPDCGVPMLSDLCWECF